MLIHIVTGIPFDIVSWETPVKEWEVNASWLILLGGLPFNETQHTGSHTYSAQANVFCSGVKVVSSQCLEQSVLHVMLCGSCDPCTRRHNGVSRIVSLAWGVLMIEGGVSEAGARRVLHFRWQVSRPSPHLMAQGPRQSALCSPLPDRHPQRRRCSRRAPALW